MLRKLLHEKTWAKALELTGLPVRRRHKNLVKLKVEDDGTIAADTDCSGSEESDDSDREVETTESYSNSSGTDAEASSSKIARQNAIDSIGPRTISSSCSSWGSNFGYVRYFDTSTDMQFDVPSNFIKGDCTKNLFVPVPADNDKKNMLDYALQRSSRNNNLNVRPYIQHSDSAENSSFEVRNYKGCEDLVNMDQDMQINKLAFEETDFITTRRSFPNYSARNDTIPKLWKSTEEHYSRDDEYNSNISDLLQVLDPPPSPKYCRDFRIDSIIIEPPPMFRNNEEDLKIINVNLNTNVPFRKHSLNSDKKIRRSMSKSMVEPDNKKNNDAHLERMSSQSETSKVRRKCECCNRSLCPSPRSSDSGVAGSCNLASPDLNMHGNDSDSHEKTSDDNMKDSLNNLSQNTFEHRKLTLSEIEAARFEEQCRCTSPFGSTARTSCVTSVTSETSFDVKDLSNTNVTSTFTASPPVPSVQIKRTSIRRNIERYVPEIKLKPEVPPRIYRKPSTHIEIPKNVRQPIPCQWSTLNITERTKPSLHYHMRIYRENPEDNHRPSRKDLSRNCDVYNKENKQRDSKSIQMVQKSRSRSEDMGKLQKGLTEAQAGFVVYRSDLYAHWWMKAKLPITVVTDSGKDNFFVKKTVCVLLV